MNKLAVVVFFSLITFLGIISFLKKDYFFLTFYLAFGIIEVFFVLNALKRTKRTKRTKHLQKVINQLTAPIITEDHNSIIISILLPQEHILKELKIDMEKFKGK